MLSLCVGIITIDVAPACCAMLRGSPRLNADRAAERDMCTPLQALPQLRPSADAQERPARVELGETQVAAAPDIAELRSGTCSGALPAAGMLEQAPCSACAWFSASQHGGRQQQQSSYVSLISTA